MGTRAQPQETQSAPVSAPYFTPEDITLYQRLEEVLPDLHYRLWLESEGSNPVTAPISLPPTNDVTSTPAESAC